MILIIIIVIIIIIIIIIMIITIIIIIIIICYRAYFKARIIAAMMANSIIIKFKQSDGWQL